MYILCHLIKSNELEVHKAYLFPETKHKKVAFIIETSPDEIWPE